MGFQKAVLGVLLLLGLELHLLITAFIIEEVAQNKADHRSNRAKEKADNGTKNTSFPRHGQTF